MKRILLLLFLWMPCFSTFAEAEANCAHWPLWFQPMCLGVTKILTEGQKDLYLTGYAWHNRYRYNHDRLSNFNEQAWGGGLGKSIFDKRGDWHSLYAFAFLDSHKNIEPIGGYAFLKTAHLNNQINLGAGLTVFLTARPDIFHNIPFPGALPLISFSYQKLTIFATYIPGAANAGNVLFLFAKWTLG